MKRIALALFAMAITASAQQQTCYTDEGGSVVCGTTAQKTHTGPTGRQVVEPFKGIFDKRNGTGSVDDPIVMPTSSFTYHGPEKDILLHCDGTRCKEKSEPFATTLTCRYAAGVYSYTGHDRATGQSRVDCSKAVEEWMMIPKGAR